MSDKATTWELRLKDLVLGPMKKLMDMATGTQTKIMGVQGGLNKLIQMSNVMGRDFKRNYSQLDTLLDSLKKRQADAFDVKHIQAYQRMIDKTRTEMERLNNVTAAPKQTKWQEFKGGLSGIASQVPGVGGLMSLATNPYTLAAGAAIMIGTATTKLAIEYQTGMSKINATAQLSADKLDALKGRIKEIGSQSGGNFELMPAAYEKILSQTNQVNLSLDILQTAVKGAETGFTDIDTVASALAQTLSAVGAQNTTASEVMDTLLKAKAVGAGEFKDFAQYVPQLVAAGNSLHVGFKDVAGLFAYMTAKGQTAADSAMLLQNAFTALQKKEVIKGLEGKGINLFDAKGMRRNIADVFLDLTKKLGGLSDRKKTQFLIDIGLNDAQARSAFSVLTSDGEKFKSIMGDVNHALGETDRQLALTGNTARTWGNISDEFKNIGESIGTYLIPVLDGIAKVIQYVLSLYDTLKGTVLKGTQFQATIKFADQQFKDKYGFSAPTDKSTLNKEQQNYYKKATEFAIHDIFKLTTDKNKIDPNEKSIKDKKTVPTTKDVNEGSPDKTKTTTTGSSPSGVSGTGSGSGARNLTQNLYITINIKKSADMDDDKLKRKLTDIIVDAGRDGLVTVGA
jgi:TP901 family phage tail tape measure protein